MPDPVIGIWPDEAIEAIHLASMALLERAGVKVESPAARELFLAAGCTAADDDRVRIPRGAVEDALAACPPSYTLAARDPAGAMLMDAAPGPTYVHNMGGARDVADPRTGAGRRATLHDQVLATRVMHHLVNQSQVTSLWQPQDVPDLLEPLYSYLVLAFETDKALGGEVTDALVAEVRRGGVVVEILPCPAAATTAPGAISAALAQQNAEVLSGVVLTQIAAPGTPVYSGPRLSAVDPRSGVVVSGTPETGVASMAAVLLARRCGLACACYGPCSDSKVVDAQFGYERAANTLLGLAARPRLLSGIGEFQAGVASSLEVLVIDDDVLNNAFYALTPRPWDADALDVEAMVDGVLSGHGFLGAKHTRRFIRSEFVTPLLGYRGGLSEWLAAGRSGLVDLASERVADLVDREPVGLPDDVLAALIALIASCAAEIGLRGFPDPRRALAL
jgi:trimethylamine--corrinoid protein Co-methyltransferase